MWYCNPNPTLISLFFAYIFAFYFSFFIPFGGLTWLPVSFLLHVKYEPCTFCVFSPLFRRSDTKTSPETSWSNAFWSFLAERYYVKFDYWHRNSVCRLSATSVHPTQIIDVFRKNYVAYPPGSVVTKTARKYPQPFSWGSLSTRGYEKSQFSTSISLYLGNVTRYDHSRNERRIVTRIRSIEWRHFRWSWVILN